MCLVKLGLAFMGCYFFNFFIVLVFYFLLTLSNPSAFGKVGFLVWFLDRNNEVLNIITSRLTKHKWKYPSMFYILLVKWLVDQWKKKKLYDWLNRNRNAAFNLRWKPNPTQPSFSSSDALYRLDASIKPMWLILTRGWAAPEERGETTCRERAVGRGAVKVTCVDGQWSEAVHFGLIITQRTRLLPQWPQLRPQSLSWA